MPSCKNHSVARGARSFLEAEWRKLAIANYQVDPKMLEPYLPHGLELDLWQGRCYVSLVGFMFLNTKLLGVQVPFHVNFEEVNLRFYVVRHEGGQSKRGVVFIREIVPKPALTLVANALYKENYVTHSMRHDWSEKDGQRQVSYGWKVRGAWQQIEVTAEIRAEDMAVGSETEFITEHYWGYARHSPSKTVEYEVTHPRWQHYPVQTYQIDVDFARTYGSAWAVLDQAEPTSVMLAEGSPITVENKRILEADH